MCSGAGALYCTRHGEAKRQSVDCCYHTLQMLTTPIATDGNYLLHGC